MKKHTKLNIISIVILAILFRFIGFLGSPKNVDYDTLQFFPLFSIPFIILLILSIISVRIESNPVGWILIALSVLGLLYALFPIIYLLLLVISGYHG